MDLQTQSNAATNPLPGPPNLNSSNGGGGAAAADAGGYQGPSFSYNVVSAAGSSSGISQQPSTSVVNSSSASVGGPPLLGAASSSGPFSYNIPHGARGLHQSSTQFSPGDGIARQVVISGNSQVGNNAPSLNPPASVQNLHANNFAPSAPPVPSPVPVPRVAAPIASSMAPSAPPVPSPVPVPRVAAPIASSMAHGNPQLLPKDQSSDNIVSSGTAPNADIVPSSASTTHSVQLHGHTSTLTASPVPGNPWVSGAPYLPMPSALPGASGFPNPARIAPYTPMPSNMMFTLSMDASSVPARPMLYPAYPSHPSVAASPHGLWLQPPQMGGYPQPQLLPYAPAFAAPFPVQAQGLPPLSVPLPEFQASGVTPLKVASSSPLATVGSGHGLPSSSAMQSDLPPGTDGNKVIGDGSIKDPAIVDDHTNAWTSHRTESGVVYYYNATTGESTYERPSSFKGEVATFHVQPIPVQWEKLAGTEWVLVSTNDGKKYYYNNETRVSSWQIPAELTELRKKHSAGPLDEDPVPVSKDAVSVGRASTPISLSAPAINTGGRDATTLRSVSVLGSSSALDLIKKKLQDSGAPVTTLTLPISDSGSVEVNGSKDIEDTGENNREKPKDANGDSNLSDSSSDSEDDNSGPTKEQCIVQFKEMLKERGVAPFSKWEKELPKILFDPRFKAIPSHSIRRSLFDHYVKTRAEEERKEKRAAQRAAVDGFKQLLDEASEDIDHHTDYHSFREKWGTDPRFKALDRKDREMLLNERILPLKKAADEKAQALRAAAASSFKSMLQENEELIVNMRWSRVKDKLRKDLRYQSARHEDRELLFNEYVSELKAKEEEAECEAKLKRQEQEKLKERERELRKRKEREEEEMERVRLKIRRKEAVTSYQALLVETIKDPQVSWTESKPKLEKDSQGRASNSELDSSDLERLFREHVKMLLERCANEYKSLLAEVLMLEAATKENEDGKTILTSWSTAKRVLKPDPRYTRMPRKDRESLWHRFADDMRRKHGLGSELKEEKHTETTHNDAGRHSSRSKRTHGRE